MKTKYWMITLALVLILSSAAGFYLLNANQNAAFAAIVSDGETVKTVSLHVDQEFTVSAPNGGENTVTVKDGKIAVTEATCPDHYCMQRGFCDGGAQIVCLPNRLVIEFLAEQEIDGIIG